MNGRTWRTALLTAAVLASAGWCQPDPRNFPPDQAVSVLDPNLPAKLHPGLRRQFLDELERAISSLVQGVRVMRSGASETLVIWAGADQLAKARKLTEQLREKLVKRAAREQANPDQREGSPVRTVVQVVQASQRGSARNPLDPSLAGPLQKAMGYSTFDVVGHAMAEGSIGEETEIFASLPWTDGSPVGLEASLIPFADDSGVRVKAHFSVSSEFEEQVVEEEIEIIREEGDEEDHDDEEDYRRSPSPPRPMIQGSVHTTYRPRAGKPLVVGATPLGAGRSLLFVVTHSGEGVE